MANDLEARAWWHADRVLKPGDRYTTTRGESVFYGLDRQGLVTIGYADSADVITVTPDVAEVSVITIGHAADTIEALVHLDRGDVC